MQVVKIRRVGNSNVISLPKELEQLGFMAGARVLIEETPSGALLVTLESQRRQVWRDVMKRVVEEDREALDMLAAYDRIEIPAPSSERPAGSDLPRYE
jgi:putative addiction module antidote